MPNSFAVTPDGLLMVASGMDNVLVWDGLTTQALDAGILPPTQTPVVAGDGSAGAITGTYYAMVRFIDDRGNPSNTSPLSAPVTLAGVGGVAYTNLPTPAESKVVARQILRNTDGQATTFYVDIDTDDLTSTALGSALTDDILSVQEAVPLVGPNGEDLSNLYGVPPNFCSYLAWFSNRMFMAGVFSYGEGNARVTPGSAVVQGVGTEWRPAMTGRKFYVDGGRTAPQVVGVDYASQTLTLDAPYDGPFQGYATYSIRPDAGFTRLVYYSEAGLPEAWQPASALGIPEDGDQITGLAVMGAYLYILERNHIWALTYQDTPGVDGGIYQRSQRGCVNDRCWVVVGGTAYLLDEAGVYTFDGDREGDTISESIQGLFRGDDPRYKIQWAARRYFHALHFPTEDTIRWFVALAGSYLPRHALCYQYGLKRWWVEEFPAAVGSSVLGRAGIAAGDWQEQVRQAYLGMTAARVVVYPSGHTDGALARDGDVAGGVVSSTPFVTALAAAVPASAVGWAIDIADGRGAGQRRIIAAATGAEVRVVQPWGVVPDATSTYRLGGVRYRWQSGWFRFTDDEGEVQAGVTFNFRTTVSPAFAGVYKYTDRSAVPDPWKVRRSPNDGYGLAVAPGEAALRMALDNPAGQARQALTRRKERDTVGDTYLSVAVSGVAPAEQVAIYEVTVEGVGGG